MLHLQILAMIISGKWKETNYEFRRYSSRPESELSRQISSLVFKIIAQVSDEVQRRSIGNCKQWLGFLTCLSILRPIVFRTSLRTRGVCHLGSEALELIEKVSTTGGRTWCEGLKIARKSSREVRRAGRAMEIGGAAMQRLGTAGGPGPLSLQGPPRSVKISPVNIQDEPGDPTSQSKYSVHGFFCFFR